MAARNQASAGDKFTFEVTVAGTSGEAYWVIYNEGLDTEEKQSVVSGQTVTFKNVQADGIIMIYGLTSGDTYTVGGRKIFCVYGKNSSLIRNRYV